jgi:hypothetical protein
MRSNSRRLPGTLLTSPAALVLWLSLSVFAAVLYPAHPVLEGAHRLDFAKATFSHILVEFIPFAGQRHLKTSIWLIVGMVKLTALCSIGSVLYVQWKKPKERLGSTSEKHSDGDEEDGKCRSFFCTS